MGNGDTQQAKCPRYAAILLAGGGARRMGGRPKPAVPVGGRPLLVRVLAAVPDAVPRVVVGPDALVAGPDAVVTGLDAVVAGPDGVVAGPDAVVTGLDGVVTGLDGGRLPDGVLLTREEPPGSGPVAAAAAGLAMVAAGAAALTARPDAGIAPDARPDAGIAPDAWRDAGIAPDAWREHLPEYVALLAADLPFLDRAAVGVLLDAAAAPGVDAAMFVDGTGRRQFLCAVWRSGPLADRLGDLATGDRAGLAGMALRRLVEGLAVAELTTAPGAPPPWFDCDTAEDLAEAERWSDGNPG